MRVESKGDETDMHWPNAVVDHEEGSVTLAASDAGFVIGCYEAKPYRQAFVRLTLSELAALRDAADALLPQQREPAPDTAWVKTVEIKDYQP